MLSDKYNKEVEFKITNNGQSSNILVHTVLIIHIFILFNNN